MSETLARAGIGCEERAGRVVALPASASEVGAIVGLARREGWIVAPGRAARGEGRAAPPHGDAARAYERPVLSLSLERMTAIPEVAPADLMAVAEAGVSSADLDFRLRECSLFWPPGDVAGSALLLDVLSCAPGNWTLLGNMVRRYVLGLSAVMADGSVVRAGSRTVKCVTGYDLRQLFIGSRGTLGVITSVTLRLEPVARREAILARYREDFSRLSPPAPESGSEQAAAQAPQTRAPRDAQQDRRSLGSLDILRLLKAELDADGVFPPAEAAFEEGA